MTLLHGDPATSFAHKLHGGQLIFTNVGVIHIGSTAKAALGLISTRITKMTRIICYRTTILTSIRHDNLLSVSDSPAEEPIIFWCKNIAMKNGKSRRV